MFIHTYQHITTMENLLATWERFRRGKRGKRDVAEFESRLADNLCHLHRELASKTYVHGSYAAFNVADPKPRDIHKASVCDRLLHHLLYGALYPYFDARFIHDSYSCREQKGTHRALQRFNAFAGKVSKNQTCSCFVLKCDIKKFFANIDHTILTGILKRRIADPDIRWLIGQVVSSFHTSRPGVGLPLGNLTSQLLVNVYMHEFDRYIKQELRVKYYVRYADDFVVLSANRKYLEDLLSELRRFLKEKLHLDLHEGKVHIRTIASGVDFLGWIHFPHHRQLRTSTKKKVLRRLKGYPTRETVNAYRALLDHGNTYRIRKRAGLVE